MLSIRVLSVEDLPFAMRLKDKAGWNQLEGDWLRFLAMQPTGCFIAEYDGVPAGTVVCCVFDSVGWIAMMLVEESLRGRGIGRALMDHALAFLGDQRVRTIRLDATPLGRPLYEKLGFVPEFSLGRYTGIVSPLKQRGGAELMRAEVLDDILALDRAVTGTNRRKFLERLSREQPGFVVRRSTQLTGYLFTRPGSRARHIGPCSANDPDSGEILFHHVAGLNVGQPVIIDIPEDNLHAGRSAQQMGLTVQRTLLRMYRGEKTHERIDLLWAGSGPEKG